jgi:hypothetical protein
MFKSSLHDTLDSITKILLSRAAEPEMMDPKEHKTRNIVACLDLEAGHVLMTNLVFVFLKWSRGSQAKKMI